MLLYAITNILETNLESIELIDGLLALLVLIYIPTHTEINTYLLCEVLYM